VLDDEFIFVCDDWVDKDDQFYKDWKQVSEATIQSIKDLNLKILFEQAKKRINPRELNWWGGYWMAVLKK